MGAEEIEAEFARRFATWGIRLPPAAVAARENGRMQASGWSIGFAWGDVDGEEFLDYFADHSMTDPSCTRIWVSGRVEDLPAPSANMLIPAGASDAEIAELERQHFAQNTASYEALREQGLVPAAGEGAPVAEIAEYLQTGAGGSAGRPTSRQLFAGAVAETAGAIDTSGPKPSFLESRIVRALEVALAARFGEAMVGHERRFPIPDWNPRPGAIDLFLRHAPDGDLRVVVEAKVGDVNWCLWDMWKMVSARQLPGVEDAYLVVAAPRRHWKSGADCVDLFPAKPSTPRRWDSLEMTQLWHNAWQELLLGGSGRPSRVAKTIEVEFVGCHDIPAFPGFELRSIAVTAVPDDGWLDFDGDWPIGYQPI